MNAIERTTVRRVLSGDRPHRMACADQRISAVAPAKINASDHSHSRLNHAWRSNASPVSDPD